VCFDEPVKCFKITGLVIAVDKFQLEFASKRASEIGLASGFARTLL